MRLITMFYINYDRYCDYKSKDRLGVGGQKHEKIESKQDKSSTNFRTNHRIHICVKVFWGLCRIHTGQK